MIEHTEGRLDGVRGELYWQSWVGSGDLNGLIGIVHGLHEHSGRYAHVAESLAAAGYASYAIDHYGHGRSEGVRGDIGLMTEVVAGVDALLDLATQRHPDVPVFLLGHSMGGLIALQYVTGEPRPLRGAVISAPAVDVSLVTKAEQVAATLLSSVVPKLPARKLDAATVSRDPQVVAAYDSDPLCYRGGTRIRTGAEIIRAARAMPERLARLRVPVLLLHGTADRLVNIAASELIARHVTDNLTYRRYEGLYHEVLNEPEKDAVLGDILAWLRGLNGGEAKP